MNHDNQQNSDLKFTNTDDSLLLTILDDSNQLVQVSEFDTMQMLYANRTARTFTAHENESYQGQYCYKYMMGLDEQCPFCPLKNLKGEKSNETEIDNGKQIFSVKTIIQEWRDRKLFIEYARDITDIRNSERSFKEQMERLLKSIPHAQGIMHFDVTDDICLTTGGISRNMKDFKNNVTVNETIERMATFTPSDEEREKFYKEFCRDSMLKAYDEGKVEFSQVTKSYFDDGSIRYARIVARLLKNPKTNHLECIVYGMDISNEIKTKQENERRLKEQLEIFDVLSKNYLNVYLADIKKNTLRVLKLDGYVTTGFDKGDAFSKEKGNISQKTYKYDEIAKQYVSERVYSEDQEYMYRVFEADNILKSLESHDPYTGTYRAIVDGKPQSYQFLFSYLKDSGLVIGGFQNIEDIVEKEIKIQNALISALKAAEQSSQAKTQFLNNMSHDMRTPMNAIIGFTTLAEEHFEDKEKVKEYLSKINVSSKHLLSLINDVLDMSKIESESIDLKSEEVNLLSVLEEIQSFLQQDITDKNLNYIVDTSKVVNQNVFCDKLRLKQILLNLLSNAVKFTNAEGKVSVVVIQKENALKTYATYVFKIKDTGIGMSKEFQKHVFEAFSRERTSTVSGIQGTGLGMAITKNLIDIMGGTIQVQSEEGIGSEFVIKLQLKINDSINVAKKTDTKDRKQELINFQGKKILLVEDNKLNQEIAMEILQEAGFNVDLAEDGIEAVSKVEMDVNNDYDLILMDIQMPKMNGYKATEKIRHLQNEKARNIPIIALSANAFEEDKTKSIGAGMDGHVAKPLDVKELLSVIREVINK